MKPKSLQKTLWMTAAVFGGLALLSAFDDIESELDRLEFEIDQYASDICNLRAQLL